MAYSTPSNQSTGDVITAAIWNQNVVSNVLALIQTAAFWLFDGGGAVYGVDDPIYLDIPFKATITRVRLLHDQASTTTVDVWKDTYANYPPTNADTITGGNEPATAAAVKDEDSTLTSWTTSVAEGDVMAGNVDANDAALRTLMSLWLNYS